MLCTDVICCYLFQIAQSRESSSNTKISQVIHTFPLLLTLVIIILYCMVEIIQERMFKSVRSSGVSCVRMPRLCMSERHHAIALQLRGRTVPEIHQRLVEVYLSVQFTI